MVNRLDRGAGGYRNIGAREQALDLWSDKKEAERAAWDKDVVDFYIDTASAATLMTEFGVQLNMNAMRMYKATSDWVLSQQHKRERNGETVVRLYREGKMVQSKRP